MSKPKILNPSQPNVTLNGFISAYGSVGSYVTHYTVTLYAAVYGPRSTDFTITNYGTVISTGTDVGFGTISAGLLLAQAGTLMNNGTIEGANGVEIMYGTPSSVAAYINNTGKIFGDVERYSNSSGLQYQAGDGVLSGVSGKFINSGYISGYQNGFDLRGSAPDTVTNSGTIISSHGVGIDIFSTGTVNNSGTINGRYVGLEINEAGVPPSGNAANPSEFTNSGFINATGIDLLNGDNLPVGVQVDAAAAVTNTAHGTISAAGGAALVVYAALQYSNKGTFGQTVLPGTLVNNGFIDGLFGVQFDGVGGVSNTGTIIGQNFAINIFSYNPIYPNGVRSTQIYNSGRIVDYGTTFTYQTTLYTAAAISVVSFGTITNTAAGIVEATGGDGIILANGGILNNAGLITGAVDGILSDIASSSISIATDGRIEGGDVGILLGDGGTVTSSGTISGSVAVSFSGTANAQIDIDPGALFNGKVDDSAGNGIMNLVAATAAGTLFGLGSKYVGFLQVTIESGADWTMASSTLTAGQTLTDLGTLAVDGAFINDGVIVTDPAAIIFNTAVTGTGTIKVGSGSKVTFDGSVAATQTIQNNGTIFINDPSQFDAVVTGSGVEIFACFASGTHILTPRGDIPVEALQVGDTVITYDGDDALIKWIGRRAINLIRHAHPNKAQPICIARNALGDNEPYRDLILSPDHALYLKKHLVPVKSLVNDANVRQLNRATVTYYHIELENHSVIFAEGTPVETYLETGNRAAFENAGDAITLHPDFGQVLRERNGCAPFLEKGPVVENIRLAILERACCRLTA